MSKEVMKQALDALEDSVDYVEELHQDYISKYGDFRKSRTDAVENSTLKSRAVITALRKAISEAEVHTDHGGRHWDSTCPACNEHEPAVWAIYDAKGFYETRSSEYACQSFCTKYNARGNNALKPHTYKPLFASPLTRAWIGLTEDEVLECWDGNAVSTARNFETKLKEKNQ